VCEPKSAAGRRVVHLPAGLVAELRRHLSRYATPDRDGLVFTTARSGSLRQNNFRSRHWYPALRAAGVESCGSTTCAT
jgi:hypothetical protein